MNSRQPRALKLQQLKGFNLTGSACDHGHFFPPFFPRILSLDNPCGVPVCSPFRKAWSKI